MSNLAPAVGFAVEIIKMLSEQNTAVGISEISRVSGINKNMVSRVLQTLEEEGWVSRDDKAGYSLTLLPFCITSKPLGRYSVSSIGIQMLQNYWKTCGESTYLGVLHDDEVLYLAHFDSLRNVRVAGVVGGSYPLYCTGPGKVLLAFSDDSYIEEYLSRHTLTPLTENTITDRTALEKELRKIRENGYSLDNEEFGKGIICMSVPVFDRESKAVGAIGISLSTVYGNIDNLYEIHGKELLSTAAKISRSLGYYN